MDQRYKEHENSHLLIKDPPQEGIMKEHSLPHA